MSDQEPNQSINPNAERLLKNRKKGDLPVETYVKGIISGDRSLLSQAITLIESTLVQHQEKARAIIEQCLPHAKTAYRIGITGVPGVGKSTFIESFGKYLTSQNHQIAVLAIDPSSQVSHGSILGDKTRMQELAADPKAFIRPSPSTGSLGGVARKTRETITLCEAAGFDTIIIETVGVGQSETTVHSMVDFFLLLMLSGAGDELQGIKRGIMEMADAIAINKADGSNLTKAKSARVEYRNALHLFPPTTSGWTPKVEICSALEKTGIDTLWQLMSDYRELTQENGYFTQRRHQQDQFWMHQSIQEALQNSFYQHPDIQQHIASIEQAVLTGEMSPFEAARHLMERYTSSKNN